MADTNVQLPLLPTHIEATIRSIARLHAEHHQNATPLQRTLSPDPARHMSESWDQLPNIRGKQETRTVP